jgi:hypothetical protein
MKQTAKYVGIGLVILAAAITPILLSTHTIGTQEEHGLSVSAANAPNNVVKGMSVNNGHVTSVSTGLIDTTNMDTVNQKGPGTYGDGSHVPTFTVDASGRITDYTAVPMFIRDVGGQVFNVMADKYGCKGDGATDDKPGIQAAFNDALAVGGQVYFPPPPSTYLIKSGIQIGGSAGKQQTVSARAPPIQSQHTSGLITYAGPSNSSIFALLGVTDWSFENIGCVIQSGGPPITNCVVWDQQFSSTYPNSGLAWMRKCNTTFAGSTTNCIWCRLGMSTNGGASNGYSITFHNCLVSDQVQNSGNIGVQIGGSQNYCPSFYDCTLVAACGILAGPIQSYLTGGVVNGATNFPVADTLLFPPSGAFSIGGVTGSYASKSVNSGPGNLVLTAPWAGGAFGGGNVSYLPPGLTAVYPGNCSFRYTGGEITGNGSWGYDVVVNTGGYFTLDTLQCQNSSAAPRRILQVGQGSFSAPVHATIRKCVYKNYQPPAIDANGLIWLHSNTNLQLDGVSANLQTAPYTNSTNSPIISNNGGAAFGSIKLKDCDFYATYPFIANNASGATWPVKYDHVQLTNSASVPQSVLNNDPNLYRTVTAATYNVTTGNDYTLACNAASNAITPTLPVCSSIPAGWTYILKKTDASANAVTVTPNGTDKIETAANYVLSAQNKFARVVNDGVSNWQVTGSN